MRPTLVRVIWRQACAGAARISASNFGERRRRGEEGDVESVEPGEIGVGGQAAVEDELAREESGPHAPVLGEAEDLVGLVLLADIGIGVGEEPGAGVAGDEGEDAALAAVALGDVVLLDQGVVAVVGNGVEVEVEGQPLAEVDVEIAHGGMPAIHQLRADAGIGAGGVFAQARPLGDHVQAGEQRQALVEGLGHHLRRPADAPELEGKQGAEGMAGRDYAAAGHVGLRKHAVQVAASQVRGEQKQATEAGAEAPGRSVELLAVRIGRTLGPGFLALFGRSPPELGQSSLPQHAVHRGGAGRHPFPRQDGADFRNRQVAFLA